jgi:hypothetical protein
MRDKKVLWLMIAVTLCISLMQLMDATRAFAATSDANISIAGFAFVKVRIPLTAVARGATNVSPQRNRRWRINS